MNKKMKLSAEKEEYKKKKYCTKYTKKPNKFFVKSIMLFIHLRLK